MMDVSKVKDGAFEKGVPADTDFERFEARSLAEDYGVAAFTEAADRAPARPIEVIEGEILFYKSQAGGAILEIGRRLIEAKKQVPHGEWTSWLEEKVQFSTRSAQRFMRLAQGYGESDTVSVLGTRKALALLVLEDNEREEFLSEKHEINGEEKTAQDMSVEELEEVIRLRQELQEANIEKERLAGDLRARGAKLTAAEVEAAQAKMAAKSAEEARDKMAAQLAPEKERAKKAQEDAAAQKADAEKYKAAADKIGRELAELKAKPVEVAVREPSEEELAALTAPAVEAARAESREQVRQLEKALAAADPDTAAFKVLFESWQEVYGRMAAALERVAQMDAGKADKLRAAIRAAAERMVKV